MIHKIDLHHKIFETMSIPNRKSIKQFYVIEPFDSQMDIGLYWPIRNLINDGIKLNVKNNR